jgi:acyl-CoA-dependent ceramide synthase
MPANIARPRGPGSQTQAQAQAQAQWTENAKEHGHARQLSNDSARLRSRRSIRRKLKNHAKEHTWLVPLVLILGVLSLYAINPSESNVMHHFIFLSYKLPARDYHEGIEEIPQYGKGLWDVAFVSFYTIVLSFTREFAMQELLRPLARFAGIKSRGKQLRFMEQMYTAMYFGVTGPFGLYVMSRSPVWYFKTAAMYEGFPHRSHEAPFKFYYLFEAAYWAQQAIVMLLGQEKRRKDFKELVAHHIVTLSLIALSYRFHFTYMGIAIYVSHDISDFFLAVSLINVGLRCVGIVLI